MKYENDWFINIIEYYNSKLKEYKVNYNVDTSDFVSPDDFDGVELSCFGMIINDKKCSLLPTEMCIMQEENLWLCNTKYALGYDWVNWLLFNFISRFDLKFK